MSDFLERSIDLGNEQTIRTYSRFNQSGLEHNPLVVTPNTPLATVYGLLSESVGSGALSSGALGANSDLIGKHRGSYVLIRAEDELVGILTERDVVKLIAEGRGLGSSAVADVMTERLITLEESALSNPFAVLGVFRRHRIRHLPILSESGDVIGVVTPDSLRQILQSADLLKLRRVVEVMSTDVIYAFSTTTVLDLAHLMATHQVSCVVIVTEPGSEGVGERRTHLRSGARSDQGVASRAMRFSAQRFSLETPSSWWNPACLIPIGIVTERDIVRLQALGLTLSTLPAGDVMSAPLVCVWPEDTLWEAHQTMQRLGVRRLVVSYSQGELAGILTQTSVLGALDPVEMYGAIEGLQQQVKQLREEKGELLQTVTARTTKLRECEEALFREKELAQVTLSSIGDAVITTDIDGRVVYFNPMAERLTGWESSVAKGSCLTEVFQCVDEITREPAENPVERVLREGRTTGLANRSVLISGGGVEYSIEESAAPIFDRDKQMMGVVIVFHDVTQAHRLARQLSWQSRHDALTRLVNRQQFEHVLAAALQEVKQGEQQYVLCYLDLDQFKVVNDTCGHIAGDELLRQISRLLRGQIRATDTLARLGGDEFGVLLRRCPLERAEVIADNLRTAIQNLRFIWRDKAFSIGVSIGLVCLDNPNSCVLTDILSAADAACYAAKGRGRNRVHVYQTDDSELVRQRRERQWSVQIQQTLADNRFCLYRQEIVPISASDESQGSHYEILIRMLDERGELILPGSFIPAAERYDLMPAIDRWVVRTVFSYIEQASPTGSSRGEESSSLHMINLSGASVSDDQFLSFLKEQFDRYSISPRTVGFEITETVAIANLEQAIHFMRDLKQLGCCFALDDFGSGMSSFAYLKTLPVDYVKIDGDFVEGMTDDPTTCAIVESINHIGHVMGLKTIAESVENASLRARLAEIGLDYVQGYGVAMPAHWV